MEKKELLNLISEVELTKKEKRVAEFFLEEEKRVYLMTVSEIADEIGVSDTSVIRFIKSIGFNNFTEFKNNGQKKIKSHLEQTNDFIKNIDLIKENSIEKLYIEKINSEINKIFTQSSIKKLQKIANLIVERDKKFVVGFKSTAGIANFFGIRLGFISKNVFTYSIDDTVVLNSLCNISEKDILIIFDYPLYSKSANILAKIAKEQNAKVILFSDSSNSPIAQHVDIVYKVKITRISLFNSLISTQIIIEYLLSYISQFIENSGKERFKNIRKYLLEKL
ncbi:MAG: MurR/RpiR family transcriptional regulator [Fusobacterium sp.]|nr:MurR/RpiR family transcriptional regulator [Fusobacterium sp.]